MSGPTRWNPLGGLARSWGHFVRRPRSTQIRTVALIVVVLVGTAHLGGHVPVGLVDRGQATVDRADGGPDGPGPPR